MDPKAIAPTGPRAWLQLHRARFEEVPAILRLIERAVERACRDAYGPVQRGAISQSYARSLFVDVLGPVETVVAARGGRMVAMAQLDPGASRLRALFVDADAQGEGAGGVLLSHMVARAGAAGCARIHGAMSLNAVPFYARAGFQPCAGRDHLNLDGVLVPVVPMQRVLRR